MVDPAPRAALPPGRIKHTPEDFRVDEIPLYAPVGEGSHLYVRFEKRGLTTDAAVMAIARELDVPLRDVGVAGLKDKVAVTTQTISLPVPNPNRTELASFVARARGLALEGIRVLEAELHKNKLKTGHLAGNRFEIVVRGVPRSRAQEAVSALERAGREGVPNFFGGQRFGVRGDNAERALAWLRGDEKPPGDPRKRRFHWSAVQSSLFNEVLSRRVADGTWAIPLDGDLLKKEDTGGLFLCTDVKSERLRAERGEVAPTGPLFGIKMREPEGAPLELERSVLRERLGEHFDLAKVRSLGEGTRRGLRLTVRDLAIEWLDDDGGRPDECAIRARFVLPKGAYATTVLATAFLATAPAEDVVSPQSRGSSETAPGERASIASSENEPTSPVSPADSDEDTPTLEPHDD